VLHAEFGISCGVATFEQSAGGRLPSADRESTGDRGAANISTEATGRQRTTPPESLLRPSRAAKTEGGYVSREFGDDVGAHQTLLNIQPRPGSRIVGGLAFVDLRSKASGDGGLGEV